MVKVDSVIKCVAVSALFCGMSLPLAAEVTPFRVEAGDSDRTLTTDEIAALVASGNDLEKTGGGRLVIDKSLKGYAGEIRIKEGYLLAKHLEAFGEIGKGTIVEDGATLEFDVPEGTTGNSTLKFGLEPVSFEGIGVGGCGALRYVNTKFAQYCQVFGDLRMTGNARISGARTKPNDAHSDSQRWDIRGAGTLDMGGHDLEIAGQFGLCNASVKNPGNINLSAVHGYGTFCLEGGSVNLNGSAANLITVPAYTKLSHQTPKAYAWSVTFDGGVFNEGNKSEESTYLTTGCIGGKLTVTENGATFYGGTKPATHLTFAGDLDIHGPVYCKSNPASLSLVVVQAADESDSASLAKVSELRQHYVNVDYCRLDDGCKIVLHTTGGDRTQPLVAGADEEGVLSAALSGTSALSLAGSLALDALRLGSGYFGIFGEGATRQLGQLTLHGDTVLDVANGSKIETGVAPVFVGASYPEVAKLRLENATYVTNWAERTSAVPALKVGQRRRMGTSDDSSVSIADTAKARGIIEVVSGGVFTNTVWLGRVTTDYGISQNEANAWCHGSLCLREGSQTMLFSKDQNIFVGSCGSGYVEQSGGYLRSKSLFYLGAGQRGRGLWYQTGGQSLHEGNIIMGNYSRTANPSKAVLWISGGSLEAWEAICSGKTRYDAGNTGNQDQITISGDETLVSVDNGIDLAGTTDAKTTLNLNGGTLWAHFAQVLTNELQTQMATGEFREYTGNSARVNFNGGVYRYRRNDKKKNKDGYRAESFFYGDSDRLTLTSYGKGANFSVDKNQTANLDHSLCAPSGKGVQSIALPSDFGDLPDGAYVGAPFVEITGDGVGATAVAEFDSVLGRVTGVTVTSPGCNYTTASANLIRGGYTNTVALTVTLGDNVSGGLTKSGEGVLRLNVANTYTGKTVVSNGTLVAAQEGAIPSASEIELAGGTLDAGGFERDYGVIVSGGGELVNARGSYTRFVKTGDGAVTFGAPLTGADAVIDVQGGTLRLPIRIPGLYAGEKIYASGETQTEWNKRTPITNLGVEAGPERAYHLTSDGYFVPNHYLSYSGYLWNRTSEERSVTFAFSFDDSVVVCVDGKELATKTDGTGVWGSLYRTTVELTPGPHAVKFLFKNGGSTGGAIRKSNVSGCTNWRDDLVGFAWDPEGRDTSDGNNFVHLADPGDGSVLTATADDGDKVPEFGTLKFAAGTALDLSGGTLAFDGTVEIDKGVKGGTPVQVNGGICFGAGARVTVPDIDLGENEKVVLMEATAGFSGVKPACADGYTLRMSGNQLVLGRRHGLTILVR